MPAVRSFPRIFTPSGDSFRLTRKNNAINSLPLGSRAKIERARPVCLGERIFCALDTLYFFFFFFVCTRNMIGLLCMAPGIL